MLMKKSLQALILSSALSMVLLSTGCSSTRSASNVTDISTESTIDTSLPSDDMAPDYKVVFNQTEVEEFNIVIDPEDWQIMQEDLAANLPADKNDNERQGGQGRGAVRVDGENTERPEAPPVDGENTERPEAPPVDGENTEAPLADIEGEKALKEADFTTTANDYEPIWVESSITFNDITWDHVGIRYKGNSSLTSAVSSGNGKLSFKLDFDEFEDDYPSTEDQRFYGFKQLNLNNNFSDASLMREKVAADLFREFGLASATTSFCIVNVDYGQGSQFFGVYALVEEMDDTGVDKQFTDASGNLYKPDGDAASFAEGSYNDGEMEKKNNEDEADYSDVEALYEIINSDARQSDHVTWKSDLEEVLNVDGFMKWLAANTVIQNWDTYGNMTHNFYLYNNPETDQLNWLPWDNNEAFTSGKKNNSALSIEMTEVGDNWPLIRYLMDDPEYKTIYDAYLQQFVDEVFTVDEMTETYNTYYDLIKDYVDAEIDGYTFLNSDDAFDQAVKILKEQVVQRNEAVEAYLTK